MEGEQNNVNSGNTGSSTGPIVGIVIILAIVVLGALYFWGERSGDPMMNDTMIENIETQSESDETSVIEDDLNSTDVEIIDVDVKAS